MKKPEKQASKQASPLPRARQALAAKEWQKVLHAIASLLRKSALTASEHRWLSLITRRVYAEALKAYRRGDRRRALQLARVLRRFPGPQAQRAAELVNKIQLWLRSQRKDRKPVSKAKKKMRKPVVAGARAAAKKVSATRRAMRAARPSGEEAERRLDVFSAPGEIAMGGEAGVEPQGAEVEYQPSFRTSERAGSGEAAVESEGEGEEEYESGPGAAAGETTPPPARRRLGTFAAPPVPANGGKRALRATRARKLAAAAAAEEASGAAGHPVTRRNPHMELSVPEPLPAGAAFEAEVWADEQESRKGEVSETVTIRAPKRVRILPLSVTLLVSEHFRIEGEIRKRMMLRRDQPETDRVRFNVKVRERDLPRSQPTLTAIFEYKGRPAGKVVRQPAIAGHTPEAPARRKLAFAPEMEVTPRREPPPAVADIQVDGVRADLTISILDTGEKDGRHYHMIVDAAGGEHWEGPWVLSQRSDELVKSAMDVFVQADESGTGTTGRIAALVGAGIDMFEATPPEFQQLFWLVVKSAKPPKTLLVVSEEPYIPWELMVPTRRKGLIDREERPPLGVEFAVGRWVHDQYISPPQKLAFTLTYVVAPRYEAGRQLHYAEQEAELVAQAFPPSQRIDPANLASLDKKVSDGSVTLLHFVCHGEDRAPQTIYLDNEKDNLNCLQVKALKGFVHTFPRARTFVFLNACEVGRPAPALVGIGGFANAFLDIGAGAVIAPLWSVADDIAHNVAKEFYNTLHRSPKTPFAKILQGIRKKAYTGKAEDTWAAYCFYGDPQAALQA